MSELVKLLVENGFAAVLIAFFLILYLLDRRDMKTEREKFYTLTEGFNTTIANHIEHETEALSELTEAVKRLCIIVELPNRDYQK